MTEQDPTTDESSRRRRLALWVGIGAVVAAIIVLGILFATGALNGPQDHSDHSSPSPVPTTTQTPPAASPTPDASEAPEPTPTIDPDFGEPVADVVPPDEQADFGDGVTARIVQLESIEVTGTQAGEASGPAIQLDLEVTNGSSETLSLDGLTVNAYYGTERAPASPYFEPHDAAFSGSLEPGETAQGRYVFGVPEDAHSNVVVTLGKAGSPIVVFEAP